MLRVFDVDFEVANEVDHYHSVVVALKLVM